MGNKFDVQTLDNIEKALKTAIAPVKEAYGLTGLNIRITSYQDFNFNGKLTGEMVASEEAIESKNKLEGEKCVVIGLPRDAIGMEFKVNNNTYTIDHIDLKKRKYPVIARRLGSNKMYKFTEHQVINKLKTKV